MFFCVCIVDGERVVGNGWCSWQNSIQIDGIFEERTRRLDDSSRMASVMMRLWHEKTHIHIHTDTHTFIFSFTLSFFPFRFQDMLFELSEVEFTGVFQGPSVLLVSSYSQTSKMPGAAGSFRD